MKDSGDDFDSGIANPFSTGGGGTTFEHLVGVNYLVSLLACDVPRGLDRGTTHKMTSLKKGHWIG